MVLVLSTDLRPGSRGGGGGWSHTRPCVPALVSMQGEYELLKCTVPTGAGQVGGVCLLEKSLQPRSSRGTGEGWSRGHPRRSLQNASPSVTGQPTVPSTWPRAAQPSVGSKGPLPALQFHDPSPRAKSQAGLGTKVGLPAASTQDRSHPRPGNTFGVGEAGSLPPGEC